MPALGRFRVDEWILLYLGQLARLSLETTLHNNWVYFPWTSPKTAMILYRSPSMLMPCIHHPWFCKVLTNFLLPLSPWSPLQLAKCPPPLSILPIVRLWENHPRSMAALHPGFDPSLLGNQSFASPTLRLKSWQVMGHRQRQSRCLTLLFFLMSRQSSRIHQ